jgi:hypothetical protein
VRERILAFLLAVSAGLITVGVACYSRGGALIVGGVLLAGWSWLLVGEVAE